MAAVSAVSGILYVTSKVVLYQCYFADVSSLCAISSANHFLWPFFASVRD